jgi:hypothetical protein
MSDRIERQDAFSNPLLGYIIIPTVKGIEVSKPDLQAILSTLHFPEYRINLPDENTVLKRAIKRWMFEMTTTDVGRLILGLEEETKVLVRDITKGKKSDILAMAIVAEESDLISWGLKYLMNLRVFYIKEIDTLLITTSQYCAGPQSIIMNAQEQSLLEKFLPHWEYYRDVYASSDISRLVRYIIRDMNPCLIKEKAGNYFIPYQFVDRLQELKDLIEDLLPAAQGQEELRAKSTLFVSPYFDKERTRKQLVDVAYTSLLSEIDTYQRELGNILETVSNPVMDKEGNPRINKDGEVRYGTVREKTILQHLQKYKEMTTKIEFYQMKIGIQEGELLKRLEELKILAQSLIS